jgi:hypothetical protein
MEELPQKSRRRRREVPASVDALHWQAENSFVCAEVEMVTGRTGSNPVHSVSK